MDIREAFNKYLKSGYEITHPGHPTYNPELERFYLYCRDSHGECDDILREVCLSRKAAEYSQYVSRFCGCFVDSIPGIPRACDPLCRRGIKPKNLGGCNPDLCIVDKINPGDNVFSLCPDCKTGKCSPVFTSPEEMSNLDGLETIPEIFPTYSCMQGGKAVPCPVSRKKSKWNWLIFISAGFVVLVVAILLLMNKTNVFVVVIISLMLLSPFLVWYLVS